MFRSLSFRFISLHGLSEIFHEWAPFVVLIAIDDFGLQGLEVLVDHRCALVRKRRLAIGDLALRDAPVVGEHRSTHRVNDLQAVW